MRVLVLGGTAEGREAAALLTAAGHEVLSSVAGRTAPARRFAPGVVSGGFGGPDGLARFLYENRIQAVVDATHPFAARMSTHAAEACRETGTPLIRWERQSWREHSLAGTWEWVADHDAAARACEGRGSVLLTVGRQPLPHYATLDDVTARVAEAPLGPPPAGWLIIADRGPYRLAGEQALLAATGARVLVTKDSGGAYTAAKLDAAQAAGVAVVIVRRPDVPEGVPSVREGADLIRWLAGR